MMFFGKTKRNKVPWTNIAHKKSFSPQKDLSNELLSASNRDQMPKLRPWEVETPIYPNGAHIFGASSTRVRFFGCSRFYIVSQ